MGIHNIAQLINKQSEIVMEGIRKEMADDLAEVQKEVSPDAEK